MRNYLHHNDQLARSWAIALLLSVVIVIALPSSGEDVPPMADTATENLQTPALSQAPHQGGMRVYLNEEGRPSLPPAEPQGVSRAQQTSQPRAELEPLSEIDAPGGGTMVILDDRFHSHSTARINADGTLSVECKGSAANPHTIAQGLNGHAGARPGEPDNDGLEGERSSASARQISPGSMCQAGAQACPASPTSEVLP